MKRREWLGPLTLLLLPWLLIAFNDCWIFSYPGSIDTWLYFGYFTHFRLYQHTFAETYYGTRLAWIAPGALAHWLLPPIAANYALHLAVYYSTVFALYFTLSRIVGRRTALLVSIMAGCYSYLLMTVGWNYPDGGGVAYYALAIACLTGAIRPRRRPLALAGAGAAFAAAVHTNLVWMILLPAFGYYYLVTTRETDGGRVLRDCVYVLLGSVLLTLALGVVSVAMGGPLLFFMPSLRFAGQTVQKSNTYRVEPSPGLFVTKWLVFPAAVLVSTVWFRARRSGTALSRLLAEHYLILCAIFVAFDAAGGALLQFAHYVSYLIPAMALSAGAQMRGAVGRLTAAQYAAIVGIALVTLTLTLLPGVGVLLAPQPALYGTRLVSVGPFLALLAAACLLRISTNLLGLALFLICVAVANVVIVDGHVWDFRDSRRHREAYRATVAAAEALSLLDPDAAGRFWYDENAPRGPIYASIASTRLWGYRLVGTRFPALFNPITGTEAAIGPGESVIVLTEDGAAAAKAGEALSGRGIGTTLVSAHQIAEGGIRLTISLLRTGVDRRKLADVPLPVSMDVFLAGGAKVNAERMVVDAERDLVHITTNRSTYDWQVVSRPIPVTPSRRHLADFELRIPTGGAGFHVIATKTQTVLASRYWCQPVITSTHQQVAFDTGSNDSVRFVLSNCGSPDPVVSDFEVKRMQVWPYRNNVAGSRH